jgi:hypothetical protein
VADRWGPQANEGTYANGRSALIERTHRAERGSERARGNRCRQAGPTGQREGERERARTRAVANRWDPPVRRSGHAWPSWAGLGLIGRNWFYFSREFLNAFVFIFSMDFKSNSNQIQIQNNFKHVHQTKE